jgi:hypothetical protein
LSEIVQNVFFGDTAIGAGARDLSQVDVITFGDAADQGRGANPAGGLRCRPRLLPGWKWGGGCQLGRQRSGGSRCDGELLMRDGRRGNPGRGRGGAIDDGEDGVDADGCALGDLDLDENAGGGCGNLGVHLVGGDFKEEFVLEDGVARVLEPLGDGALEDRFAHLGHDYVGWHQYFSPAAEGRATQRATCRIINRRGSGCAEG